MNKTTRRPGGPFNVLASMIFIFCLSGKAHSMTKETCLLRINLESPKAFNRLIPKQEDRDQFHQEILAVLKKKGYHVLSNQELLKYREGPFPEGQRVLDFNYKIDDNLGGITFYFIYGTSFRKFTDAKIQTHIQVHADNEPEGWMEIPYVAQISEIILDVGSRSLFSSNHPFFEQPMNAAVDIIQDMNSCQKNTSIMKDSLQEKITYERRWQEITSEARRNGLDLRCKGLDDRSKYEFSNLKKCIESVGRLDLNNKLRNTIRETLPSQAKSIILLSDQFGVYALREEESPIPQTDSTKVFEINVDPHSFEETMALANAIANVMEDPGITHQPLKEIRQNVHEQIIEDIIEFLKNSTEDPEKVQMPL